MSNKVKQLRAMREAQYTTNGATMTSNVPAKASGRLAELETTIEKSARAVWDMAEALKEIRGDELWKQTHATWAAYCEDRWGISKQWANSTIQAVEIRAELAAGGKSTFRLPAHVGPTSELSRVPVEDRPEVWGRAVAKADEDGTPEPSLHRHVRPAIKEYQEERAAPPREPSPADRAHEAARDMRRAAEGFATAVEVLMPHLDNLADDEAQGCAYKVVETVHAVLSVLQEHGHIRGDVARALMSTQETGREIGVA